MYKVFIENRPVIICEKNTIKIDSIILSSEKVTSFEETIFPLIKKSLPKIPIILIAKDAHLEFERLFDGYKRIVAAGGIVKRNDEYLFIKRNGKWDIPKGKLNKKEDAKIGAVREIEEECGISNPIMKELICCTYHTYKFKNKPRLKLTYWYELEYFGDEVLVPQLEEGITKVKWLKVDQLEKVKRNTFLSILEVIDHYFKPEDYLEDDFEFDQ